MAMRNRTMHDVTHRVGSVARDTMDHLRHSAGDYLSSGREGAGELAHTVQDTLREHPIRWLLVGIGIGCLISAAMLDR